MHERIKPMLLAVAVSFCFITVAFADSKQPEKDHIEQKNTSSTEKKGKNQSGSTTADMHLFSMSADDFFSLKIVQQPIDFNNVQHELLSAAIYHATNQRRVEHDLKELGHSDKLDEASHIHAESMVKKDYFSHINPDKPKKRTPADRVEMVGLVPKYVAENIATHFGIQYEPEKPVIPYEENGQRKYRYRMDGPPIPHHTYETFAQTLLDAWMGSTGHRRNILSQHARMMGSSCVEDKDAKDMVKFYCVQTFFAARQF